MAAAASAVACAPPAKPPRAGQARLATATSAKDDTPRSYSPRHAKLKYEILGHPFPLATGTIAGQPVLMLVDTGANSRVIAGWLPRKLGLGMKKLGTWYGPRRQVDRDLPRREAVHLSAAARGTRRGG